MTRLSSRIALGLSLAASCGWTACDDAPSAPAVEPGENLPGGSTTNTLLLGQLAFSRPATGLAPEDELHFFTGNSLFNQPWVQAPSSTEDRDGLGPLFNARSCSGCHFRDGRAAPPEAEDDELGGLLLRISVPGTGPHGGPLPDPIYGGQLQPLAIDGVAPEATVRTTWTSTAGAYADGETYELVAPKFALSDLGYGPLHEDAVLGPRVAPAMIGLGLLEAISEARLQELADPADADGDGISGEINYVWHPEIDAMAPGRFGWKAEKPSVRAQAAGAFLGDMGITSSVNPAQACTEAQAQCADALDGGAPEISDKLLDRIVTYSSVLAVPVRREWDDADVLAGKALFRDAGCADCHTPSHVTGQHPGFDALSNQRIWPYTDLLLHDMGPELADGLEVFSASGPEWRTAPLWGIGLLQDVNGHERLLHDGRARGVAEAILWHGGEAETSREAFIEMSAEKRRRLIRFVRSL